jgi:hypothetical protein
MKKLILFTALLFVASTMFGQLKYLQVGFGTKTDDSLVGGAPAGGTTKYLYLNQTGTVAGSIVKSTTRVINYEIYAVSVSIGLPTKAADMADSVQITLEISFDNTNWVKWSNGGFTTNATQTQHRNGAPKVFGTGVYTYATATRDMIATGATAGGGVFMPLGCVAPYSRIKFTTFKASSSAYPIAYYVLKQL